MEFILNKFVASKLLNNVLLNNHVYFLLAHAQVLHPLCQCLS